MDTTKIIAVGCLLLGWAVQGTASGQGSADPLYQSRGDQKRSYKFPPTGEKIEYRTYVPKTWTPAEKLPLVVVLHGGGLDDNAPFERTPAPMKDELQKLAEEFRFIVVSPMGYNMGGGFGAPKPAGAPGGPPRAPGSAAAGGMPPMPAASMPPQNPKESQFSEEDVMNVVKIVEEEYGADTSREFITGNSMGGIGTVYLASKYPDKWTAMAPSEAGFDPARYGKLPFKVKGALFIHKEDPKAPQVDTGSMAMVKILSDEGIDAHTISVPNTVHENVWFFALPITFHFFDKFVHPPAERVAPQPR